MSSHESAKRSIELFPPYIQRPATIEDLDAVTELVIACERADYGTSMLSREDTANDWRFPHFDLAVDSQLVLTSEGQLAGYAILWDQAHIHLFGDLYVHPHAGAHAQDIRERLLRWLDTRAAAAAALAGDGVRVTLTLFANAAEQADPGIGRAFIEHGFALVRHSWRMRIELREPPEPPVWPQGITVRTRIPGQDDHAIYAADEEAFADHFGHLPMGFEDWRLLTIEMEGKDPSLWFLAIDGDQIAGTALCEVRAAMGWVNHLGVRRPWRKRGLGVALLQHAFGEFYHRGYRAVGLGVDAQNLTGAVRLYERAGMVIERRLARYEKELRAGHELSTQQLAESAR